MVHVQSEVLRAFWFTPDLTSAQEEVLLRHAGPGTHVALYPAHETGGAYSLLIIWHRR